ncbi:phage protein Gp27 family protein [Rhodocyclus tenuis]|nr:phage protein Gp27 family protein [Rhodocyclus tenuis]
MARRSKISELPADLRQALDKLLADQAFGDYEGVAAYINEQLAARGMALTLSRTGVHRYGQQLERRMEQVRAATEAARQIASCSEDSADDRSAAVIAMIQSQAFDVMMNLEDAEKEEDREARLVLMTKAARAMSQLVRASIVNKKYARDESARLQAMEADARSGKRSLDAETLRIVREEIYGIV